MLRSILLSLPLQLGFPVLSYDTQIKTKFKMINCNFFHVFGMFLLCKLPAVAQLTPSIAKNCRNSH
jgi:hypothetical protein